MDNEGKPVVVTDSTFDELVLRSDKPVLTDFWAVWCGPCKMIAPILEEIAREYKDRLTIAKLDVDHNPNTAIRYGVQSIPTLILFKNGHEKMRLIGAMSKERLLAQIEPHLDEE